MMDELDILDDRIDRTTQPVKRTAFVTVLCILTFVGAGLGIIYSFVMWVGFTAVEGFAEAFDNGSNNLADEAYRQFQWLKFLALSYLVGNVLCIVGAIIMMFMRKVGFYIYILGQVIPIAIILFMLGGDLTGPGAQLWIFLALFFPVGFIVMYGLNYKDMR